MITKIERERLRLMVAAGWANGAAEAISAVPKLLGHMDEQDQRIAELLTALKGIRDIEWRLPGCNVPNCRVCKDNASTIAAADAAIAKAEGGPS